MDVKEVVMGNVVNFRHIFCGSRKRVASIRITSGFEKEIGLSDDEHSSPD